MAHPTEFQYSFFRITRESKDLAESVQKYKELRLQALSVAPASFSSTYEIESALTDAEWTARLAADRRETFVCSATPIQEASSESTQTAEWVAQLTLRGPLTPNEFSLPQESGQKNSDPEDKEKEERWQMLSLFTLPGHRGQGLGQKLCQEALAYLRLYRDSPLVVRVRLMVKPDNHVTVGLYRKLGFVEVGKCTLAEALVANGDADLLPGDISGEKYATRSGLVMMLEMSRS